MRPRENRTRIEVDAHVNKPPCFILVDNHCAGDKQMVDCAAAGRQIGFDESSKRKGAYLQEIGSNGRDIVEKKL